ncbi:MAG TPA: ABC transporter permease [Puia sp.]|jgi:putative ABC transport system permease protein|nr:ABC transporter permease [Puia sp.]
MLTHYLRVAFRVASRHKLYSLINIGCLAIGLAAVMTILLYILHEHSYDGWHVNARRIYSVTTHSSFGSSNWTSPQLSYPAGPAALASDPGVESMVRVRSAFEGVDLQNPKVAGMHYRETTRFLYADSNFFRFFSFRLLRGNPESVLARPYTVVLTQSAAKKYFGNVDPVGQTLTLDKQYLLEVTGVAADMPSNSSLNFDMVASIATMKGLDKYQAYLRNQQLETGSFRTWLLLRGSADTSRVARNLSRIALVAAGKLPKSDAPAGMTESHQFSLLPLTDTHLKMYGGIGNNYLGVFSWVAALILILAILNYMSLATARSAMRAKEVGVRKVIGGGRRSLAGQFYMESTLYAVLAFAAGVLLFLGFRPSFCQLMQLPIDAGYIANPVVLGSFAALLLVVILISGSYPALVLSSFRPVLVLYGKLSRQRSAERIRKGFLVFQFSLSMALLACAFVVGKELYYIRHMDTGVARENIVMFPFAGTLEHYAAYRSAVAGTPGIGQVATSMYKLYSGTSLVQLVQLPGKTGTEQLTFMITDSSLIPLLGLEWKEKPSPAANWFDRGHLALNEAAVDAFHWRGRASGNQFKFGDTTVMVSGVLKDFNFSSLHSPITPLGIQVTRDAGEWGDGFEGVLYAKIGPHVNVPSVIEAVHRIYARYDARTPFEYTFLDEEFDSQYKLEDRLAGLMNIFTTITIVIACLGLFALAAFAAQQRLKEIGIRKVLGASVASISVLLSRDFLRPVLLSVVIASPLAWWFMHRWLQDFAYRTAISWWIFPATGVGLLLIAQLTVLLRTVKAARTNPTVNLRSE